MSYKVLLIDADTEAGERYRNSLLEAGHQLIKASDARKATEALEKVRPDLALVVEDSGHLAAPALCAHLKKTRLGGITPFIFLAVEAPADGEELARRIEKVGCDRMLSQSVPVEELVETCAQLVGSKTAASTTMAPAKVASTTQQAAAAPEPGSGGDAEGNGPRTDSGNTHPVIGAVASAPPAASAPSVPTDKEANRDAPGPESFSTTLPPAGPDPVAADDAGSDIEAHLDSLFGGQPAAELAKPEPPRPRAEAPPRPKAQPAQQKPAPPRPEALSRPASPQPAPHAPQAKPKPAAPQPAPHAPQAKPKPAAPARAAKPVPAAPARPAKTKPVVETPAAPTASATPAASPAPTKVPTRETPKAVEQLRMPRVPEVQATNDPGYRRYLPIAAGIAAATVVIGLLAVVYFAFMRGESTQPAESTVAQVQETPEPLPAPAPLESSPFAGAAPVPEETPETPRDEPVGATPPTEAVKPPPPKTEPKTTRAVASSVPPAKPATSRPKPPPAVPKTKAAETNKAVAKSAPPPAEQKAKNMARKTSGATIAAAAVVTETPKQEVSPPPVEKTQAPPTEQPASVAAAGTTVEPEVTENRAPQPSAAPSLPVDEPVAEEASSTPRPGLRPPVVIERVEPEYSAKAARGVDNPVVVLRVLLDERGKIVRVNVEQGIPGSELEAAAISAIMRWRFHPGTEFGVPVRAWTTARFVFEP